MGLAPIDAAGVGQPTRIDQNGDAYQQRIREGANLEIPKNGVDRSRNDRNARSPNHHTGLSHEAASSGRGEAWQNRELEVWERYSEGHEGRERQPTSAAVVIDQGLKKAKQANQNPIVNRPRMPDEDTEAWRQWHAAHVGAAESEEYAQDRLGPFMKTPKEAKRRRYAILNSR